MSINIPSRIEKEKDGYTFIAVGVAPNGSSYPIAVRFKRWVNTDSGYTVLEDFCTWENSAVVITGTLETQVFEMFMKEIGEDK